MLYSAVVRPDKLLSAATFDLKSAELDLNKRYGKLQKVEFGHRVNLKIAIGKRLSHRQVQRQLTACRCAELLRMIGPGTCTRPRCVCTM